jgi:hypothetical protein
MLDENNLIQDVKRVRRLTTIQINKEQKQSFDQAYKLFNQGDEFKSKGQFIKQLADDYFDLNLRKEQPVEDDFNNL